MTATISQKFKPRAHLATTALLSFIISFAIARIFTTFFQSTVLISNGIHIHHFWFGILLLAGGGWLGISYSDKDIDRLAAILYGAGVGLIVDEVGLLLTFGDYWTDLTYTFLVVFLAVILVLILFNKYRQTIMTEFREFVGSKPSIFFGIFLFVLSIAFISETSNLFVIITSSILAAAALAICVVYVMLWLKKHQKRQPVGIKLLMWKCETWKMQKL